MILTHLMGGLGNQMFQYAAGKALSIRLGLPMKLYFNDHYKLAKRNYALEVFNVDAQFPTKDELAGYLPASGVSRRIKKLLHLPYTGRLYREHKLFEIDRDFFEIKDGVFLSGFWQNRNYFASVEPILRNEFHFRHPATGYNSEKMKEICQREIAISIHVRRTDYINPASGLYPLPLEYYKAAINVLKPQLSLKAHYYVFTDDTDWVLKNFPELLGDRFELITHNRDAAHEDLRLMATCHHHIIANSSFSWWGAWLNARANKIVVAPKEWMKGFAQTEEALFTRNDILV